MRIIFLLLALPLMARATDTFTGQVITVQGLQAAFNEATGGKKFILAPEGRERAVVRYDALRDVMESTWKTMSRRYGVKVTQAGPVWDKRFDCVAIDLAFNLELRSRLFTEYWMSRSEVRRVAAVMVLFRQDRLIIGNDWNHAVMFIVTDRGPVWWDPSTGQITLSKSEIESLYFFTP